VRFARDSLSRGVRIPIVGDTIMAAFGQDRAIVQQVTQRLETRGLRSPCRIDVQVRNGEVTLTGQIQFAQQRSTAMSAASTATGVRQVVDRLTIKPPQKRSQH
jgi:osmotically-inducible protein OsmY